ncbi:hypothetical protein D3C84_738020 [compost metagenome]
MADTAQLPRCQVPHQRVRAIVDLPAQAIEALVQIVGLGGFGTIQRGVIPGKTFGLATVDLPAIPAIFIDQDGLESNGDQGFGTTCTGRPGADDNDSMSAQPRSGHIASGCVVTISRPSRTSLEQARRRSPLRVQTQQS